MSKARLPEHPETCSYRRSQYNLWTNCTCRVKFNDRQFGYWQKMARRLVVQNLVRAAHNADPQSIAGYLAAGCLIQLADHESPGMTNEILIEEERHDLRDLLSALRSK